MSKKLKLRIELVPEPLWGRNLRSPTEGIGVGRWKALRLEAIDASNGKCAICGGAGKLHGHEVWKYTEKKTVGVATLARVEAVCMTCHNIGHWGNTQRLIALGRITHESHLLLRRHFRKINGVTQARFEAHIKRSFAQWRAGARKKWRIDWGQYAPLIEEAATRVHDGGSKKIQRRTAHPRPCLNSHL